MRVNFLSAIIVEEDFPSDGLVTNEPKCVVEPSHCLISPRFDDVYKAGVTYIHNNASLGRASCKNGHATKVFKRGHSLGPGG